jgi:hypothetical protein
MIHIQMTKKVVFVRFHCAASSQLLRQVVEATGTVRVLTAHNETIVQLGQVKQQLQKNDNRRCAEKMELSPCRLGIAKCSIKRIDQTAGAVS